MHSTTNPALPAGSLTRLPPIGRPILAALLCLAIFSQSANADKDAPELKVLFQEYEEAQAKFSKTKDYGQPYRDSIETAQKLLSALINYWMSQPEDSEGESFAAKEIKAVFKVLAGSPLTEKHNLGKSFIARAVWPLLANSEIKPGKAKFLEGLVKPQMGVRMNDQAAKRGKPTEPLGWDVQAAYVLALVRSDKEKQASEEISILHKKVTINHGRNPDGKLDFGADAGKGRYRDYKDFLQLCEALHALQASISKDFETAHEHIAIAQGIKKELSPEADTLAKEAIKRAKLEKE